MEQLGRPVLHTVPIMSIRIKKVGTYIALHYILHYITLIYSICRPIHEIMQDDAIIQYACRGRRHFVQDVSDAENRQYQSARD